MSWIWRPGCSNRAKVIAMKRDLRARNTMEQLITESFFASSPLQSVPIFALTLGSSSFLLLFTIVRQKRNGQRLRIAKRTLAVAICTPLVSSVTYFVVKRSQTMTVQAATCSFNVLQRTNLSNTLYIIFVLMITYSFITNYTRDATSRKTIVNSITTAMTIAMTNMDPSPLTRLLVPNLSIPVSSAIEVLQIQFSPESHAYGMNSRSARAFSSLKKMRVCIGKLISHICMNIRN